MIQKAWYRYLKGFLIGIIVFFSMMCEAQPLHKKAKDSALQTRAGIDSTDSAKIKATAVDLRNKSDHSDTSLSLSLMKLEKQVIQLNKDIALLRQGFDTSEISEEMPAIERGLDRFEASLGKMQSGTNLRNLNSIKVALQQVQKMVKKHQETLNGYSETLAKISVNQARSAADSLLKKMPGDSILRINYLAKLNPVVQKWKINDSLLTAAIKSVGLLQSGISGSYLKCAELLNEVNAKIKNIQSNLLRRDAPFLWQVKTASDANSLSENIQLGFKRNFTISLYYLSLNAGSLFFVLFLGAVFFVLNQVSVRKLRKSNAPNWEVPLHFLKNKIWLPTLLVVFTLLPFSMKNPPAGLVQFLWLLMLLAATLIRWKDWPVAFRRMWIGIIAFFILFSIDSFFPEADLTERSLLVIFNLAATALGWYMYREVLKDKSRYHALMDESILIFLIVNLLAFLMNLGGRVNIARILSNSAVLSIALLLALQIIKEILLEFVYLQVEAYKHFSLSGFVEFNKMKERFRTTLSVITLTLWILALAWSLNLYDIVEESVGNFLMQKRTLGEFSFSFSSVLVFVGIVWLSMLAGRLVTFIFHGDDSNVVGSRKNKSGSLMLFGKLGIYTIGVLLAFAATGIGMDKFAIIVGALGVGIGFGLQNIVNNLVSGVILAIEKPMEIGDVIELGTRVGTVKEIGFRSSKISTFDGSVIIVPNGDFISQQLINWTHSNNNYRRVEIIVGVQYGSNLEQVKTLIDTIIQNNPDVAKYPAPNILINEFASSSVNIRVLVWTADYDKWVLLKSKMYQEIYESFAEHSIEIPVPQTDLHIKSIDPGVAEALRGKSNES
jgi:potassium-dependent mechanosensitive channel